MATVNFSRRRLLLAGAASPLALSGCGDFMRNGPSDTAATQWNGVMTEGIRAGKLGPPMVSRAMAIANTAAFDAWAPYHSTAVATQAGGLTRVAASNNTEAAKSVSISYAMYRALVDVMPFHKDQLDAAMAQQGLDITFTAQDTSAAGIGNAAAARVLAFRANDGSNQKGTLAPGAYADYTGYQAVNTVDRVSDPTRWQPMRFSTGAVPSFLAPHWGNVVPFALTNGAALRLTTTLPAAGSREYREQADYVLELTSRLSDEQKVIAEYWANGPRTELPPGHWNLFAQDLSRQHQQSLDADVVMYFLQANAVMDAGIVCWDCKRHYDAVRPITAIRSLYAGQTIPGYVSASKGIAMMAGETWSPWQPGDFITPPFAEFTSGHSTFSAASAEILKRFYGSDTFGATATFSNGQSLTEVGVPKSEITLNWSTFSAAADEAGASRLYGGIHFERANSVGKTMGRQVGAAVWDKTQRLLAGQRD
jgi:hypothetical protein